MSSSTLRISLNLNDITCRQQKCSLPSNFSNRYCLVWLHLWYSIKKKVCKSFCHSQGVLTNLLDVEIWNILMGWCWWEVLERETKDIERKSVVGVRQPPTSCDFETAHHDLLMTCQESSQKYKSRKGQLVTPVNHVTLFGPKVASSGTKCAN